MNKTPDNQLISAYIPDNITEIRRLTGGHINHSFLVMGDVPYILQSLNRDLFEDSLGVLISNYEIYRENCDIYNKGNGYWECPVWLKNRNGDYFQRDNEGNIFRMYRYIPSDEPGKIDTVNKYEIGKGLGKMHRILSKCRDIGNIESIAHLHDLSFHYNEYLKQNKINTGRIKEIDDRINDTIESMLKITVPSDDIVHADAGIKNMIVKDGRVAGFIDLDTIMTGSVYDDIADCARSCCTDEKGQTYVPALEDLIKGYEDGSGIGFSADKISLICENIIKHRFMLGLRYYTDHLSGRGYFNEEYPGQSLDKARTLFFSPFMGIM
ncbi:MAG: phosphotransferase [Lachnospiraceae bacterium]|nr:phosphotransferase [Lachnospiraceae bacterium]